MTEKEAEKLKERRLKDYVKFCVLIDPKALEKFNKLSKEEKNALFDDFRHLIATRIESYYETKVRKESKKSKDGDDVAGALAKCIEHGGCDPEVVNKMLRNYGIPADTDGTKRLYDLIVEFSKKRKEK